MTRLRLAATLVAVAAVATLTVGASSANASSIVYQCGLSFANLCRINSDGTGQTQLTTDGDGSAGAYTSPSLSRDGTRLAFVRGSGELFVADGDARNPVGPISNSALVAYLSPDGTRVADLENFGLGEPVTLCSFAVDGSGRSCPIATGSGGWGPGDQLLASTREASGDDDNTAICLLPAEGSGCDRYVAQDLNRALYDPTVSPDGKTVAVTAVPTSAGATATSGSIALFDYASGSYRTDLTSGTGDETPAWSPDGSQIAFARGGMIYVAAADGAPGGERPLVAGQSPTWGGGGPQQPPTPPGGGPQPPASSLRIGRLQRNKRRGTATLAVSAPTAGSLGLAGKAVKRVSMPVSGARKARLPIKAKGHAKRKLARKGKAAVKCVLTFTPSVGAPRQRRLTIKLVKKSQQGRKRSAIG